MSEKKPKRVILLTIDALRYDFLDYPAGGLKKEKLAPNIAKFAKKSVIFNNVYSQGPYTKASFPAIFFSQYSHKVTKLLSEDMGWGKLKDEAISWLDLLNDHDFKTVGYSTNPFVGKLTGYKGRFDKLDDRDRPFTFTTRKLWDRLDKKLKALFIDRIWKKIAPAASMDSPYINSLAYRYLNNNQKTEDLFLWLHYMDVHGPYYGNIRPAKISRGEVDISQEKMKEGYKKSIKHLDKYLGDLFAYLKRKGFLEDSLIIITSDHGEMFGEHGHTSHPGQFYQEVLRVPLIIYHPLGKSHLSSSLAGLVDIGPTILDSLNIDIPTEFDGKSLLPVVKGKKKGAREVIISEVYSSEGPTKKGWPANFMITDGRFKLTRFFKKEEENLYDLKNDPMEKNDISKDKPELVEKLKEKFKQEYFNEQ